LPDEVETRLGRAAKFRAKLLFYHAANLGRAAGAGIDKHVHFHIVPRWSGDTNFMPVLADVKLISEDMRKVWKALRQQLIS